MPGTDSGERPNILFIMTDQQRFDTIAALGNSHIYTPNFDRLVARGASFANAYSTTPVCVPARYTIRTGCESPTTGVGMVPITSRDQAFQFHSDIEERCGPYLAATMSKLGYRTFGVGKFHTIPWDAPIGFDIQLYSEELYGAERRQQDSYVSFIAKEHPEYAWLENLHGERTEMYYIPQRSPLPADLTVEAWAANQAIDLINIEDDRPWFGFVSFIGPHPPFAPPQPFNRIYDPDRMPNPVSGERAIDHMDQYLPWMNHMIWAEDINNSLARILKARYYGEITYIDQCVGSILDAVERRQDSDNTLICFFADHGEHLGDHHSWQKESFFEASARVPYLISWPHRIPVETRTEPVCLTDLFGLATSAAGKAEFREGSDVLGLFDKSSEPRNTLFGFYGQPGSWQFKLMVRRNCWKLIYLANGGMAQLFDTESDPHELNELSRSRPDILESLLDSAVQELTRRNVTAALDGDTLLEVPFKSFQEILEEQRRATPEVYTFPTSTPRIYQFDPEDSRSRFPAHPSETLN